jgi:hypothetical protein
VNDVVGVDITEFRVYVKVNLYLNLMVGHQCPIIHQLNPKAPFDIKNGQSKAMKAALRLSRRHVHTLIFEIGFYFQSLIATKPLIKDAPSYLGHQCPAIRCMLKMDEKVTKNPTCVDMDNVWWSLEFCCKRTQIGCLNKKMTMV